MLEKLRTKQGESSLLIVLVFAAIVIFILLPFFALILDKGLMKLATQEITDQIDLSTYRVFHALDLEALSSNDIQLKEEVVDLMNEVLIFNHPQIDNVLIKEVKYQNDRMTLLLELKMVPTLYRTMYDLTTEYTFKYTMMLPIDGDD